MSAPTPGLRERTRWAQELEIRAVAMNLFAQHGFNETTMDQIAMAAGTSRRTLFRYFKTKEEIVLGDLDHVGTRLRMALEVRPSTEGPWDALRAAFAALQTEPIYEPKRAIEIARMIGQTPSLRAIHADKQARWQQQLVPVLQARMGLEDKGNRPHPRAVAITSAALSCFLYAIESWIYSGGTLDTEALYDQMVAAVRQ